MKRQKAWELIESALQWEGKFTSKTLEDVLGVSRQTITEYKKEYDQKYPGNFEYDSRQKIYLPSKSFTPKLGKSSFQNYLEQGFVEAAICENLPTPGAEPAPENVQKIMQAIKHQQRIDVRYISMSSPDFEERIISPHSIVFDGRRYHLRAWCEKNQDFRDFVLSRIHQVFDLEGQAEKTKQDDQAWLTEIEFYIEPEPKLTPQQQQVIALDYAMEQMPDGRFQRKYKVRKALLIYWIQQLRIDVHRDNPQSQQIIISPESEPLIKAYLSTAN